MTEFEEFAYALLDQLSVELNEEKEIIASRSKAEEAFASRIRFDSIESVCERIYGEMAGKVEEFTGIPVPHARVEFPDLVDFKRLKGRKVYPTQESAEFVDRLFTAIAHEDVQGIASLAEEQTARYLVYSTYARGYISQISTTYGDYYQPEIYLNRFILSSYPQIILYKQGEPYEAGFERVNSGYMGALKMTMLEEMVHSVQGNLYGINRRAVTEVNEINEELARVILALGDDATKSLYGYLQLPEVPDEYPVARRANLFFTLNPDNFIVQVLGPDVMTFNRVTIDPKIQEMVPQLLGIYQRWLRPIQEHHAAFTAMEGMAEFAVRRILGGDADFGNYLVTFANSDISAYQVRKSMGTDFTGHVFGKLGSETYKKIIAEPPTTRELKDPQSYLDRR